MAASVASPLPALRQGSSVCAPHAMASSPYASSSMSSSVSSLKAGAVSKGGLYGIKELKCVKKPSSTSVPQQVEILLSVYPQIRFCSLVPERYMMDDSEP